MFRSLVIVMGLMAQVTLGAVEEAKFYQVKALPGDGIYSLLRRYDLDKYSCNFDQFYALNKLKRNAALRVGRSYYLPIILYTFNGKTIRSSVGIDDWDLAVGIQRYNEAMEEAALRTDSFKKSKELWVPYHMINCPEKDLSIPEPIVSQPEETPGLAGKRQFPIFGKAYAYTPLINNKLKGQVFYVVAGHGGPDPGAMGKSGKYTLCEDEYAYDVALRLCRNLVSSGATAYMINRDENDGIRQDKFLKCDSDERLWGDVKMRRAQKERLFQRSDIINELYEKHLAQGVAKQTAVMIHVDSRHKGERTDLFFYHHPSSSNGRSLALELHKTIKSKYKKYRKGGYYHGTVSGRDLHMLRECKPLSVYIELANIRNTYDQQRIIVESNRQLLADWIFEGLLK